MASESTDETQKPALLLVVLHAIPALGINDPELVEFWVTTAGRGERRTFSLDTPMPLTREFAWGSIRLVDRDHTSKDYLTFGGRLDAAAIDEAIIGVFDSPAPLLRSNGPTQGRDVAAEAARTFFARLKVAIGRDPGFEALFGRASPMARYAAFVGDASARRQAGRPLGWDARLDQLIRSEARRLRAGSAADWSAGQRLLKLTALGRIAERAIGGP